jgi:hypothetical protein
MATDTPEMQAILQRIERLEAENRRLRRAVLGVALLSIVIRKIFLVPRSNTGNFLPPGDITQVGGLPWQTTALLL